jgi:tetratricopeptide (TPR) repeat protein
MGPAAPLFQVMMIIWAVRFIQGKSALARSITAELLALAETQNDDSARTEAHWAGGCTTWWAGAFAESLEHCEHGMALHQIETSLAHQAVTQQNSGPLLTAYSGLSLWILGKPAAARQRMAQALAMAEKLAHPFTSAVTLWKAGTLAQLHGDGIEALRYGEKVFAIAQEQSFAFWIALGLGLKGGALLLQGRHHEAVRLLQESLARSEATGCEVLHPHYLLNLAEALWRDGQRPLAWDALRRGQQMTRRDQQCSEEAELLRLEALFLVEESHVQAAEACLSSALTVARAQRARFYELRSALALARLWSSAGRGEEGRALVAAAIAGFAEGADGPDLAAAREFLAGSDPSAKTAVVDATLPL